MTARRYATAGRMPGAIGTPVFTQYSLALYRRPNFYYTNQKLNMPDAARFFLKTTDALLGGARIAPTQADIPAEAYAAWIQPELDRFFGEGLIKVVIDATLAAKAIAGASRIRLRASSLFSELYKNQLLQHEAFVHVVTAQNGALQPNFKSLGLGRHEPPRLRRVSPLWPSCSLGAWVSTACGAWRCGCSRCSRRWMAPTIQVVEGFWAGGHSQEESFCSTQRVFRGADLRGDSAFTKDAAYLTGMLGVHMLWRIAIRDNRPDLVGHLLAGRLSLGISTFGSPSNTSTCKWLSACVSGAKSMRLWIPSRLGTAASCA